MDVSKPLINISVCLTLALSAQAGLAIEQDDDSVDSWGRWMVLSPAAGPEDFVAFAPEEPPDVGRCEASQNCPGVAFNETPTEPPPPTEPPTSLGPCFSGQGCGFARSDYRSNNPGSNALQPAAVGGTIAGNAGPGSDVGYFELELVSGESGGSETAAYRANVGDPDEIASGPVDAQINASNFRTTDRGSPYRVLGNITRDADGTPVMVEGFWRQVDPNSAQSGEYVWGLAASETEMAGLMDQLQAEGGTLVGRYEGATGRGTGVELDIDFGAGTWSGDFAGGVPFTAGGTVGGTSFVSDPEQFSGNIDTGVVEGGFVNAGSNAIGGYDVTDLEGLREADVFNTLRQPGGDQVNP